MSEWIVRQSLNDDSQEGLGSMPAGGLFYGLK